jgi:antitoxin (DNA-binding transcriptional repressor) of toxin-antitoxin stability system
MPLPKRSRKGEIHTVTMMELRHQPGEVFEAVHDGAFIKVTKQGRHVGTIVPVDEDPTPIVIRPDGTSEDGRMPFTFRQPRLLRN